MSASACDEKGRPPRKSRHLSLYPEDILDITADPLDPFRLLFLSTIHATHFASPQSTLLLNFSTTCNPPNPSPHPDSHGRLAHRGSWNRIQLEGSVTQNSGSGAGASGISQVTSASMNSMTDGVSRASWVARVILATSTTRHAVAVTCCARCKGHGTWIFIGCPGGSSTLLSAHVQTDTATLLGARDCFRSKAANPKGRPLPESLQSSRERMVGGNQSRGRTRLCVRRRSAYGESGGAAGAILHIPGPPHAPGPGGDAAPGARVLSNRALQFSLTVPFSSHAEADIARHFLTPRTQLQGPIRKELNVNGRMLVLRLTAEDPGLLQRSIAFCLEQLSLVMRSLQHFVAPVSAKPQHGRGV
ncbi:uncharacterized protein LOC122689407 [Cervus elaphus]|uniref:uncharacterized protein LOC122689407 n=1 Tax=Cervus elaphus TaxID=9860 RepID=UPI001CC2A2EA|nr:uncharacterized protein LOC122689407 [Cervus elaphus]